MAAYQDNVFMVLTSWLRVSEWVHGMNAEQRQPTGGPVAQVRRLGTKVGNRLAMFWRLPTFVPSRRTWDTGPPVGG